MIMAALIRVCIFFVALLLFSLQKTAWKTRVSVGAAAAAIAVLIFWSIWNSWDPGDGDLEDELTDFFPD